jgi:LL-diaminopimelate aminotransferase
MRDPSATRLGRIPPYLFKELDDLKAAAGGSVIDLGEGSPDQPTPKPILGAFQKALKVPENHRYPTYAGKLSCRAAVAAWYRKRFGVELDPGTEVTMLLGSKEGVGHLIWGTCGTGDVVAIGDPCYPVYPNQARLAGATPVMVPLHEASGFLPELGWLERVQGIKLLCLNYPANPTAAVAPLSFYGEVVRLARQRGFFVVNDCVYSELYFGREKPPSILSVPGAKECCIEFHSLSKTFNMAGWRIGMAVGNAQLVQALLKIKQNTDSGPFGAIQDAAVYAFRSGAKLAEANRRMYRERRDVFCDTLAQSGWEVPKPEATFYVWTRIPEGFKGSRVATAPRAESFDFTRKMLADCRVVCAPGKGFGQAGEGFVRFALVDDKERLARAAERIGRWVRSGC